MNWPSLHTRHPQHQGADEPHKTYLNIDLMCLLAADLCAVFGSSLVEAEIPHFSHLRVLAARGLGDAALELVSLRKHQVSCRGHSSMLTVSVSPSRREGN